MKRIIFAVLIGVIWPCSHAETNPSCELDCVPVGKWQLDVAFGVGGRTNPVATLNDTPLLILPELSYYGERFFLRNLELGYALVETPRHQFNWVFMPSYDQMYFNEWDPFNFTDASLNIGGGVGQVASQASQHIYSFNVLSQSPEESDIKAIGSEGRDVLPLISGQAESFNLNGQGIALTEGRQSFVGRDRQTIWVDVNFEQVTVWGLGSRDNLQLTGARVPQLTSVPTTIEGIKQPSLVGSNLTGDVSIGIHNSQVTSQPTPANVKQTTALTKHQIAHRKMAGLMGLEYHYYGSRLSLHAQGLHDVTGVHQGNEWRMAAVLPWQWQHDRWALTLAANYKSQSVLNYYFGVGPRDTVPVSAYFSPARADIETKIRLDWQRPLSARWTLKASAQLTRLPRVIESSPLLDTLYVGSVFVGGVYHF